VRLLGLPDGERRVHRLERDARLVEQLAPRVGQLDPVREPDEQRLADLPLELLDLTRERGLGDVEPRGRAADAALFRDRDERAEVSEVDRDGASIPDAA